MERNKQSLLYRNKDKAENARDGDNCCSPVVMPYHQ